MGRPKKNSPEAPVEAPTAPRHTSDEGKDPGKHVVDGETKKYLNAIQKKVFERQEGVKIAKEKRISDALDAARESAKGFELIVIPYKDRNEEIVPAIVLGVVDQPKKDKGGPVMNEFNEQVMESVLRIYVLSNIDEPRKVLYNIGGK
jgi:hypothetical protein